VLICQANSAPSVTLRRGFPLKRPFWCCSRIRFGPTNWSRANPSAYKSINSSDGERRWKASMITFAQIIIFAVEAGSLAVNAPPSAIFIHSPANSRRCLRSCGSSSQRDASRSHCLANSMQSRGHVIVPSLTTSRTPHAGGAWPSLERGGV
jgi:hypothetical protein